MKNFFVTGGTGYMGGHLILGLLRNPNNMVYCLVRSKTKEGAKKKLYTNLINALETENCENPNAFLESVEERIKVVKGNITEKNLGMEEAEFRELPTFEQIIHSAASLKFSYDQKDEILAINLEGTKNMLDFTFRNKAHIFNYVSTAYVAGTKSQEILEQEYEDSFDCNNMYEESKRLTESLVISTCREREQKFRILRPSIIIGHSKTHKSNSDSGLYGLLRGFIDFYYRVIVDNPKYFINNKVKIVTEPEMNCNLVPVDFVVNDCIAITNEEGLINKIFHLSAIHQVPLDSFFKNVSNVLKIIDFELVYDKGLLNETDKILYDGLIFYKSYFLNNKIFDRSNSKGLSNIISEERHMDIENDIEKYCEDFMNREDTKKLIAYYNRKMMKIKA